MKGLQIRDNLDKLSIAFDRDSLQALQRKQQKTPGG